MTDKAWSGKVDKDSIRVYNRAITSEEIVRIMTRDEIMQLTGRELDAAVAKAMGKLAQSMKHT